MTNNEPLNEAQEEFQLYKAVDLLQEKCHYDMVKAGWWTDMKTGESLRSKRNVGEAIALMHSELSEALEAHRKNLMDDKLPERKGLEVELADTLLRIFDFAGGFDLDLAGALIDKMAYNRKRADHKLENRSKDGGKAF